MFDGTWTDDDKIFSIVVTRVEIHNHISGNLSDIVNVTKDGLAHHVILITIEIDVLH